MATKNAPPLSPTPFGPLTALGQFTVDVEGQDDFKNLVSLGGELGKIIEKTVRDSTAWSNVLKRTGMEISAVKAHLSNVEKASLHINAIQRDTVKNYKAAEERVKSLEGRIKNLYKDTGGNAAVFSQQLAKLGLATELDKAKRHAEALKKTFDSMNFSKLESFLKGSLSHIPIVGSRLASGIVPRAQGVGGVLPFTAGTLGAAAVAGAGAYALAVTKAANQVREISSSFSILVDRSREVKDILKGISWTGQMNTNEAVAFVEELKQAGLKIDEIKSTGEEFLKTQIATGTAVSQQVSLYNLVVRQTRASSQSISEASRYAHVMIRQAAVLGQHFRNVDIEELLKGAEEMKTQTSGLVTDAKELVNQFSLLTSAAGLAALGLQKAKFLTQDMVKGIAQGAMGLQGASLQAQVLSHVLAFPGQSMSQRFASLGRMRAGEDQAMDSLTGSTDTLQTKLRMSLGPAIAIMGKVLGKSLTDIGKLREQGNFGQADNMLYAKEAMVGDELKRQVPAFANMSVQSAALLTHKIDQKMADAAANGTGPGAFMSDFFSGGAQSPFNAMLDGMKESGELQGDVVDALKAADTTSIEEQVSKNTKEIANWTKGPGALLGMMASQSILGGAGFLQSLLSGGASKEEQARLKQLIQEYADKGMSANDAVEAARARVAKERKFRELYPPTPVGEGDNIVWKGGSADTNIPMMTDEALNMRIQEAEKKKAQATAAQTTADASVEAARMDAANKIAETHAAPASKDLVKAMIAQESRGNPIARSVRGGKDYVGLMQLGQDAWNEMLADPTTQKQLQAAYPGRDLRTLNRTDSEANVIVGSSYINRKIKEAGSKKSAPIVRALQKTLGLSKEDAETYLGLAYYNAGAGTVTNQFTKGSKGYNPELDKLLSDPSNEGMEKLLGSIQIGTNKKGGGRISLLQYMRNNFPAEVLARMGKTLAESVQEGPPEVSSDGGSTTTVVSGPLRKYSLNTKVVVNGMTDEKSAQAAVADVAGSRGSGQGAPAL